MEESVKILKVLFCLVMFFKLFSCAHNSNHQRNLRSEADRQERSLQVGMSYEEVMRKHSNLGNCRGSKASIMICEWQFSAKSEDGISLAQIEVTQNRTKAENLPAHPDDGFSYELIFNEGKLSRWRLKDNSEGP